MAKAKKKQPKTDGASRGVFVALGVAVVAGAVAWMLWQGSSPLLTPSPPMPPSVLLEPCKVPGEPDRRFRIMKSTVPDGGNGVFLEDSLHVREKTKLCLYDGEDVYKAPIRELNTHYTMEGTIVGLEEGWVRNGFPSIQQPCGVGQIINDGASIILEAPITWRQAWQAVEE